MSLLPRYVEVLIQTNSDQKKVSVADILPELLEKGFELSGNVIFEQMGFKSWMNHGADYPPSAQAIKKMYSSDK